MLSKRVHLSPDHASRYPHEFSGGQRQRICIARALALEPRVIVADESVSALDVSVRGQVLDLLLELQEEMGLAYLFISHDMAVIERMSHDVAVMRGGEFVEYGTRRQVFENPTQDYTKALMQAVPVPIPRRGDTDLRPCCNGCDVRETAAAKDKQINPRETKEKGLHCLGFLWPNSSVFNALQGIQI